MELEIDRIINDLRSNNLELTQSHLFALTTLHRKSLEASLAKKDLVAQSKEALAETLMLLANWYYYSPLIASSNYRIKSLDHKLLQVQSIATTYRQFLPPGTTAHDDIIKSLSYTLDSRKNVILELEAVRKRRDIAQARRDAKLARLNSTDKEIEKSISLSQLSSVLSRCVSICVYVC